MKVVQQSQAAWMRHTSQRNTTTQCCFCGHSAAHIAADAFVGAAVARSGCRVSTVHTPTPAIPFELHIATFLAIETASS